MTARASAVSEFHLSRCYAQGWAAGTRRAEDELAGDVAVLADELNPGKSTEERQRWAQGFVDAVARGSDKGDRRKSGFAPRRQPPA